MILHLKKQSGILRDILENVHQTRSLDGVLGCLIFETFGPGRTRRQLLFKCNFVWQVALSVSDRSTSVQG